jgi:transposase-like protein
MPNLIPLPRDDSFPGTLADFVEAFRDDASCATFLRRWKYGPDGFRCPRCGHHRAWALRTRHVDECRDCGVQTSLTAGTVMHGSRKPLRLWFLAIYLFVSSKQGISALELKRELGLGSYQTAWTWLHKLRRAIARRPKSRLRGCVEADETWEGGLHEGRTGRPRVGEKKALVAAAVEVKRPGRRWGRARLESISSGSARSIGEFLRTHVEAGSRLLTDAWPSYRRPAKDLGLEHHATNVSKSEQRAHHVLPAVHRVFSLLHRMLLTTFQGAVSIRHLPAYLAEFEFRFNRRTSATRGLLFQRALSAAVLAPADGFEKIRGGGAIQRAA